MILKYHFQNNSKERKRMNINSKISIAVARFFRRYGRLIIIVVTVWVIILFINNYLKKHRTDKTEIQNAYTPDIAIMDDDNISVPERYRSYVKQTIDNYFNYCNSKEFENAYNMLSDDCKAFLYQNSLDNFVEYANNFYTGDKKYYIQNYSNIDNKYIYEMHIIDDIEKTGGSGGYNENVEKLTVIRNKNEYKIANQGYIENKRYDNIISQTENMVVKVISKDISYGKEAYNLEITNKTDKYILISDGTYSDEVTLNITNQKRKATNTQNATFLIGPNSTKQMTFIFEKFVDDENTPTEINLNDVRIYENYNTSLTPEDAEKLFSFNIKLTK